MEEESNGEKVMLYVYDISQGMARQMSLAVIGKQIDGIWHTNVAVYGEEHYFGGGVMRSKIGETRWGPYPVQKIELGETHIPKDVMEEYLDDLRDRYSMVSYDILDNNCNHFSADLVQFLTGRSIPDYIEKQVDEVIATPLGRAIVPLLRTVQHQVTNNVADVPGTRLPQGNAAPLAGGGVPPPPWTCPA
eukprot:CAMPEP_0119141508 /NCGR_PEP_ID=MMETSP1310-20130426/31143_1 /TAXON_ID=464262 /ORGANISM="Genus nov. species nov., Strain RCC2339" /LENGTH=189 /DNA_ID=CAMNT_0007132959 /DNA_START=62 /DNA_END=628 /DNA_ORIENTATION=+